MSSTRRVLVTGGASGLGRGIAEAFAELGDEVIIADSNREALASAATEIGVLQRFVDISSAASVAEAVDAVATDHGGIDVLVNNAGIVGGGGSMLDLDVSVLDAALAVNVRGTFLMTQAVGRLMAAARSGSIVNVSSIGARQPTPGLGHYEATKAAIDALTRTAAIELAPYRVRVNAVAPGPIITPLTRVLVADPQARSAWEARIPLGSVATVDQVCPLVVFLAGDTASHITGTSVPVDGGQLLS
ncbi:SDR family NAD(P)-dependent oxidoreductase [Subtercola sp. YIM 133946]|uniref:SDR family NAD(P)-dependent oxidoreductase n=1 Tax=Subtercola sp. YIM 133946 TaxID=3118909 RepID=UPI002F9383D1